MWGARDGRAGRKRSGAGGPRTRGVTDARYRGAAASRSRASGMRLGLESGNAGYRNSSITIRPTQATLATIKAAQ